MSSHTSPSPSPSVMHELGFCTDVNPSHVIACFKNTQPACHHNPSSLLYLFVGDTLCCIYMSVVIHKIVIGNVPLFLSGSYDQNPLTD